MFEKIETGIHDCFILKPRLFSDDRGDFVKLFHDEAFKNLDLCDHFKEMYFSTSLKGVIRGMHLQVPPEDHIKCVSCLNGMIYDVVVDLRKKSPTYGQHFSTILTGDSPKLLYIPKGLAHGFMALTNHTIFLNNTSSVYDPDCDDGIHWNSCGIDWPMEPALVSEKDKNLPPLDKFESPF
ncbi:MAG: dTDP-4-dehydrorhamnose 3,5-epimerase [Cyclobacteriaceae bacterium]